jgi:hypothetical protein
VQTLIRIIRPIIVTAYNDLTLEGASESNHELRPGMVFQVLENPAEVPDVFYLHNLGWVVLPLDSFIGPTTFIGRFSAN